MIHLTTVLADQSVRLIFDSASQYTFVTKEVVETLKLKPVRIEKLLLSTFGNETEEIKTFHVLNCLLKIPRLDLYKLFRLMKYI